ncbi:UNVERIFIED_CONTAM: Plastidic glucose transporter 4 [Sesamum calycinum]|uniref:Plastidic glucose transporter 4 n=1 Tax=Sesamum calycinum TaxID=2727403 RepID=A0AAW2SV05_9LAMI
MQASAFAVEAKSGSTSTLQNSRILQGTGDSGKKSLAFASSDLRMTKRKNCFGLGLSSASMGVRGSIHSVFGSSAKARSVRAQASGGDVEDVSPSKIQVKSSGTVFPYVGVACLGAILFGYHLGLSEVDLLMFCCHISLIQVVNGALEYLAKDLGIAENTVLQGKLFLKSSYGPLGAAGRVKRCTILSVVLHVGWVVSTLLAGATVGSFTGGSLADKFGRTKTFLLDAIPLVVGAFLCVTAQSVETMIIGRLLAGIGIGISSAIVPLYISEISPTEIRGTLGSVNQLFICVGILAALVAGLPLAGNPLWWRTMFAFALVPSVLLALGMAFSPESPRWLYQQGKISEAEVSIKRLFGKERVAEVMSDLDAAAQGSAEPEAGCCQRWCISVLVPAACWINAVVYYSTSVFRSAGITSDVAASALVGAANVFGTTIASSLMDKQGRKSLLLTSFAGMAASMLLLSLTFTWPALAPYSGTLAVLGTVLYVLSFSLGAGPVPALLLPEIFASRIRAKAVALSLGMHWISNFVIGLYFLSVVNKFGISTVYLGFASVCLLAVMYVAGNVVETKGRSLEEIERALSPAI